MSDEIALHVQLTKDDYLAANMTFIRWKRMLSRLAIVTAAIAFIFVAAYFGSGSKQVPKTALNFMGIWVVIILACLLWIRFFLVPRRTSRIFAQQKGLQRPHTISWNETEMSYESEQATARTPWTDLLLWRENNVLFMLYFSEMMFRMMPKRAFPDEDSISSFRELLRTKISPVEGRKRA